MTVVIIETNTYIQQKTKNKKKKQKANYTKKLFELYKKITILQKKKNFQILFLFSTRFQYTFLITTKF